MFLKSNQMKLLNKKTTTKKTQLSSQTIRHLQLMFLCDLRKAKRKVKPYSDAFKRLQMIHILNKKK